ncbi:hypothetical protein K0B04_02555 [Patescibacteria group bacterium]|nr:hypothetical protein [Patescibacteria group bacterium]
MYKKIVCDSEFVLGVALDFFEGDCKNSEDCFEVREKFLREHLDYTADSGYFALVKCRNGNLRDIWKKFEKSLAKNKDIKQHFRIFALGFESLEDMSLAIKIFNDRNLSFPILSDGEYRYFECVLVDENGKKEENVIVIPIIETDKIEEMFWFQALHCSNLVNLCAERELKNLS